MQLTKEFTEHLEALGPFTEYFLMVKTADGRGAAVVGCKGYTLVNFLEVANSSLEELLKDTSMTDSDRE